jgi:hypothetical protein
MVWNERKAVYSGCWMCPDCGQMQKDESGEKKGFALTPFSRNRLIRAQPDVYRSVAGTVLIMQFHPAPPHRPTAAPARGIPARKMCKNRGSVAGGSCRGIHLLLSLISFGDALEPPLNTFILCKRILRCQHWIHSRSGLQGNLSHYNTPFHFFLQ